MTANTITHPHANYTLRTIDGQLIDVLPTPRLLDEVGRHWAGVEAYESDPATDRYPAIWRVRDDSYDPAGTTYTRVTAIVSK